MTLTEDQVTYLERLLRSANNCIASPNDAHAALLTDTALREGLDITDGYTVDVVRAVRAYKLGTSDDVGGSPETIKAIKAILDHSVAQEFFSLVDTVKDILLPTK